jgi:hypothetical protein
MARETKAQRASRIGMLLAEYDEKSRQARKLAADLKTLKEQVREIEPGTYGEWAYAHGTPREILDQKAAKDELTKAGISIPTQTTEAPIVVTHVGSTK